MGFEYDDKLRGKWVPEPYLRPEHARMSRDAWDELEYALEEAEKHAQAMEENAETFSQEADENYELYREWRRKAEMYRKQLGGTNAALNRARDENKRLKESEAKWKAKAEACMALVARMREEMEER